MSVQRILVSVFSLAVTFLVPTVVWVTLVAGLLQLIRKGIHRLRVVLPGSRGLAHKSAR
jgi:hypothetical protein